MTRISVIYCKSYRDNNRVPLLIAKKKKGLPIAEASTNSRQPTSKQSNCTKYKHYDDIVVECWPCCKGERNF